MQDSLRHTYGVPQGKLTLDLRSLGSHPASCVSVQKEGRPFGTAIFCMARDAGFEPAAFASGGQRSIQLS